jgi:hypothetical protein
MYLIHYREDVYRCGDDMRDTRRYYDGRHNVYVAMEQDFERANQIAADRGRAEGRTYFLKRVLAWPLSLSAALACRQEYRPNAKERSYDHL